MTPQERQLVTELFDRLATLETTPRDGDAETCRSPTASPARRMQPMRWCRPRWCRTRRSSAPMRASATLKARPLRQRAAPGGFLDAMRASVWGSRAGARGSVPTVRPGETPMGAPSGYQNQAAQPNVALSARASFARRLVPRHRRVSGGRRHWRRTAAQRHPLDVRSRRRTVRRDRSRQCAATRKRRGAPPLAAPRTAISRDKPVSTTSAARQAATIRMPGRAASGCWTIQTRIPHVDQNFDQDDGGGFDTGGFDTGGGDTV